MKYPIVEIFRSIQGEGAHVGMPAVFIRLAGCNLTCDFCDTPNRNTTLFNDEPCDIVDTVDRLTEGRNLCALVVITGGEPTIHDLNPLVDALRGRGYFIVIESNGVENRYPLANIEDVHYSIAPKAGCPVDPDLLRLSGSVKILCDMNTTLEEIDMLCEKIYLAGGQGEIYLQPKVGRDRPYMTNNEVMHTFKLSLGSGLSLSLQIHKILGVN